MGETIDSIINQTYQNIELIIVNDGSSDNTDSVIRSYLPKCKDRFSRIEYINKQNEGTARTLNRGLALAKGQYIGLIASDDKYTADAIEILHLFLSNNCEYGFVTADNYIIDDEGKRCFWGNNRENVYDPKEALYLTVGDHMKKSRTDVDFNSDNFGSYLSLLRGCYITNGYLIKKDIFDLIGGYNEKAQIEDINLFLQVSKVTKMKYIDRPLFYYRWHGKNYCRNTKKFLISYRKTLSLEKEYVIKAGYEDYFNYRFYNTQKEILFLFKKIKRRKFLYSETILKFLNIIIYIKIKGINKKKSSFLFSSAIYGKNGSTPKNLVDLKIWEK